MCDCCAGIKWAANCPKGLLHCHRANGDTQHRDTHARNCKTMLCVRACLSEMCEKINRCLWDCLRAHIEQTNKCALHHSSQLRRRQSHIMCICAHALCIVYLLYIVLTFRKCNETYTRNAVMRIYWSAFAFVCVSPHVKSECLIHYSIIIWKVYLECSFLAQDKQQRRRCVVDCGAVIQYAYAFKPGGTLCLHCASCSRIFSICFLRTIHTHSAHS